MRLQLEVTREGKGFKIKAESPLDKGSGFFELDSSLKGKLDEIYKSIETQELLDKALVEGFGTQLFRTLFSDIKDLFHSCLDQSDHLDVVLNMEDPQLCILPWEICYDKDYDIFLGADSRCSLVRRDQESTKTFREIDYPLNILVIISSPMDLDEKGEYQPDPDEIEKLMEPVKALEDKGMVTLTFLERASVVEIQDAIKEGYHIVHFVGHGSYDANEDTGYIVIEDKDRNSKKLAGSEVAQLFGVNPPQLVIFTACESSPLIPFLLTRRIPAVLAMQYSVWVNVAHEFVERFYSLLLKGDTVMQAVSDARAAVRLEEGVGHLGWFTPVLYVRSENVLTMNTRSVLKPPEREIVERFDRDKDLIGEENFVGRRKDLWLIEKALFEDNLKLVVIEGIGGIGKSSLASKFVRKHKLKFQGVFAKKVVDPSAGVEEILVSLDQFLLRNGDERFHEVIAEPDLDLKLDVLNHCLKKGYLLVLDNVEILLEDSRIKNEEIEKFLQAVAFGDHLSKVLITTRYGFTFRDEKAGGLVRIVDLDELSLRFAMQLLEKLEIKNPEVQGKIREKIGGNPQFLEFFAKLARSRSVKKLLEDITPVREKIGEWLLRELVGLLTDEEENVLKKGSVYRRPVMRDGFDVLGGSDEVVDKLVYYSLVKMDRDGDEYYFMHPGVREYVDALMSDDERDKAHSEGAMYYEMLIEKEKADLPDFFELHYHLIESAQYEEAGNLISDLFEPLYMWGFREELIGLLVQTMKTTEGKRKAWSFFDLGKILDALGEYEEAEKYYEWALDLFEELGNKQGIAASLHQLGNLQYLQGNYKEAEEYYKESLDLTESLGDKQGIARSLHQLGMLQQYQGNYKEAEEYYKESLDLKRSLGDKQGIATSLGQLGMLQQYQGNYKEAEEYYKESLDLSESLGDKQGIARSLYQLGRSKEDQGNYKEAEEYYKESLDLSESLGDKQGIARSLYQLGRTQQYQGNYKEAEEYYKESLDLSESLGNKQIIAASLHQLGRILEDREDYEKAVEYYINSLAILLELNSPDAETAVKSLKRVRETMGEAEFDTCWKTTTNQEVPDFLEPTYEEQIDDFVQYIMYVVDNNEHEELERAADILTELIKESSPDEKQLFQLLLDYISRKDISQKMKELKEPYKSILEEYLE